MRYFDPVQIELHHAGPERLTKALQEYRHLRRIATLWLILVWARNGIAVIVMSVLLMFGIAAPAAVLYDWFGGSFLWGITALSWFYFFLWLGSGNKKLDSLWSRWKEEAEELSALWVMHSDTIREIRGFQRDRR